MMLSQELIIYRNWINDIATSLFQQGSRTIYVIVLLFSYLSTFLLGRIMSPQAFFLIFIKCLIVDVHSLYSLLSFFELIF